MCELTQHGMAGERPGTSMGTAWARHGMCELSFRGFSNAVHFLLIIVKQKNVSNSNWIIKILKLRFGYEQGPILFSSASHPVTADHPASQKR
jgi:hypothetical protein